MFNGHKVVVTMTSWTKRIGNCRQVVEAILKNTVKPDAVYLNLAVVEFPNKEADLPKDLVQLAQNDKTFIINWVEGPNTKPWKKLFPTLQFLQDDDLIVLADDDLDVDAKLVETRVREFDEYGGRFAISGGGCYRKTHLDIPLLGVMSYNTVCPTTILQKKMMRGWESIMCREMYNPHGEATYDDDCAYSILCLLNGFKILPSKYMSIKRRQDLDVNGLHKSGLCISDPETMKAFEAVYNKNTGRDLKSDLRQAHRIDAVQGMNLVMWDSLNLAGDNAEYFYRKVKLLYPNIKMTFLLSRTSKDWSRLQKDGFNLVSFDSPQMDRLLKDATYILFSKYNPPMSVRSKQRLYRNKSIFLQHGTISKIHNIGSYIRNSISKVSKYICCSSEDEKSLINSLSRGSLSPIVSGLPRHDELARKVRLLKPNRQKRVFISFHWRRNHQTTLLGTRYLWDINALLNSKKLKELCDLGVKVSFLPHAMFMKFLPRFRVPKYIDVPKNEPFQDILVNTDVLVTDFSSNSFELALLNRPSVVFVPGVDDVKRNQSQYYSIENLNYPQMSYCSSLDKVMDKVYELLNSGEKFDFAHKLFKYVDDNSTDRLLGWMVDHRDSVDKSQTANEHAKYQFG